LSKLGFSVGQFGQHRKLSLAFTNPLEALKQAATGSPNLLLSDDVMPELSGVDLAVSIKEKCPDCKILSFSGQAETTGFAPPMP
jgi:CheY-like chemotaxis protein